jgi:hypothetical protein
MNMLLIDDANPEENWADVLTLWSRIANWTHYKPSERALRSEMKLFLIALWSEKDWLKQQYPAKASEIEKFIDRSKYLPVVADLANTAKHRRLTRPKRSTAAQTKYYGRVVVNNSVSRRMHYISLGNGRHAEIMTVLRGALDELEEFRFALRAGSER